MAEAGRMGIARTYGLLFGLTYMAVALIELFIGRDGWRAGDATILELAGIHNAIHWLTGLALFGAALMGERTARLMARIIGFTFVAVTILGFVAREFTGELVGYDHALPWSYNWIHLATAATALFAGFASRGSTATHDQRHMRAA